MAIAQCIRNAVNHGNPAVISLITKKWNNKIYITSTAVHVVGLGDIENFLER